MPVTTPVNDQDMTSLVNGMRGVSAVRNVSEHVWDVMSIAATANPNNLTSTSSTGGNIPQGVQTLTTTSVQATSPNQTSSWLCDANNSQLWQLQDPLCTTRYNSIFVFAIVTFLFASIILWTVLGNILVLVALYRFKSLRTMSNCLIGNLAISDLLLATTVLPISSTNDLLGYWVFGEVGCALWLCMDVLYCTASVWGLCTVAFDRYMATAYPVWYHDKRSTRKAVWCVVFVWIFSMVISFAPFIGWHNMITNSLTFNTQIDRFECILFMTSSYVIYSSTGSFVIPTCLMTFMYIRIFSVLHKQSHNIKRRAQYRKVSRRRAAIANGCPTIKIQDRHTSDAVARDFTTTTLVSMSAMESSFFSDDKDDAISIEHEHLLNVPQISLHSANGLVCSLHDTNSRLDEIAEDGAGGFRNGDAPPSTEDMSASNTTIHSGSSALKQNTSLHPGVDKTRASQKRSHSVSVMSTNARSMDVLNTNALDRRKSCEDGASSKRLSFPDSNASRSDRISSNLLHPACHRSKSANVLSSSDEDGSLNFQRPSLPCLLTKFGRNSKMTQSMKRRFELREQRATKRMLLIMACFCMCWMPFVVMYITRSLCHQCHMNTHFVAAIIWLGYVNSSLNPILYSLFNDDFKAAFKRILGMKSPPPRRKR